MTPNRSAIINISGQRLVLLPEKAVFWKEMATLIVADLHLGKGGAIRAAGIPVPAGSTEETLCRLEQVIKAMSADRLIILGDMLHHPDGDEEGLAHFYDWRKNRRLLDILLIPGNHDRMEGVASISGIRVAEGRVFEPPFVWSHHPEPHPEGYTLAGHLHPGVRLTGPGRQSLILHCFHFTTSVGTLPAFGGFTGISRIRPAVGDRIFVVAGDTVIEKSS